MKAVRTLWYSTIFGLLIGAVGLVQHDRLGAAVAALGITLIMMGMSLLAEWYAEGSRNGEI